MRKIVLSICAFAIAPCADAQVLYGVDFIFPGSRTVSLIEIDTATGMGSRITNLPGISSAVAGLAFDTSSDTLYGGVLNELLSIDPFTGQTAVVADLGSFGTAGMTYDAATGLLLAIDGSTDTLYSIDPDNGDVNVIGATGYSQIFGLTIDPENRVLYGFDGTGDQIVAIDPDNAAILDAVPADVDNAAGLVFDSTTQMLLASVDAGVPANSLYSIDPLTGQSEELGRFGFGSNVQSLAFVPSPGTAGVVVLGGIVAVRRRR